MIIIKIYKNYNNLYFTETLMFLMKHNIKRYISQIQRISIYIPSIICFDRPLLFELYKVFDIWQRCILGQRP